MFLISSGNSLIGKFPTSAKSFSPNPKDFVNPGKDKEVLRSFLRSVILLIPTFSKVFCNSGNFCANLSNPFGKGAKTNSLICSCGNKFHSPFRELGVSFAINSSVGISGSGSGLSGLIISIILSVISSIIFGSSGSVGSLGSIGFVGLSVAIGSSGFISSAGSAGSAG